MQTEPIYGALFLAGFTVGPEERVNIRQIDAKRRKQIELREEKYK